MLAAAPALGFAGPAARSAAVANAMVDKVNQVRASYGLAPLRPSGSLDGSSQRFAAHLMQQNVLQHRASPSTSYSTAGEVLGMHTGRRSGIGATVSRWMRSTTHRTVLLSRNMREMGAGLARGRYGGNPAVIWVVQVGKR